MDGQRARRMKCGTPIGRLIDEAGDGVQYAFVAMIMGFVLRVQPGWLCLAFALINLPMFSMEIKYILTGTLSITAGDDGVGPVEIELLFTVIFVISAIFGVEGLGSTVGSSETLQWKHLLSVVFVFLLCFFTVENLASSLKLNFKKTAHYLMNPIFTLANASLAGYLGLFTFKYEFVVFFLLHQIAFCISSYRLMLSNMVKSDFRVFHFESIFVVVPTLVQLTKFISPSVDIHEYEKYVTYGCLGSLFVLFYLHMYLLSQQYLARGEYKNFWVIRRRNVVEN